MKQFLIILFLVFFSIKISAQTDLIKRKSVFFELAGSGGLGSINFEKSFRKKNNTEFTWRVGLSIAPIDKNNGVGIVFPLMVNAIIGKNAHKIEFGLGQGITITTKGSFFFLTTAAIGYRYQREDKHWFYRVTYTPLISYLADFQVQQWGGISIGYTLNTTAK
ncbi:MAG: hypothetical protein M3R17_03915 [Bacteroidota bacterium]|nr:hypothetical protein [Bacteroidota bacterium]